MNQKLKNLLSAVAFLLIFALLFSLAAFVLRDKRYAANASALYDEPKDSVDVIYAGSSHMLNGVLPLELFDEAGIVGVNVGQNAQLLPETYYALKEVFRHQSPELVVLDVYMLHELKNATARASLHFTLDAMEFGLPKLEAIWNLPKPEDRAEYLIDFIAYHTRWKELTAEDFKPLRTEYKGAEPMYTTFSNAWYTPPARDDVAALEGPGFEYLQRIVDLCRAEGAQLLLVALPFAVEEKDPKPRQQLVNACEIWATEQNIPFVNYPYLVEEVGLDMAKDFSNIDHLNETGAEKLSRHLAAYLAEHYELPDRRGDANYPGWN